MRFSYSQRDTAYGAAMLTLRTKLGLTQASLANHLGISRRAVGEWEAGSSYPKTAHLKELIVLAIQRQAFASGHEAEEIHALWKAAHQKVLLDEHWLSTLLNQQRPPLLYIRPPHVAGQAQSKETVETESYICPEISPLPTFTAPAEENINGVPIMNHPAPGPRVDWEDAQTIPRFYGREQELALLSQWVVQEHCRVVSVLGMGGIGKSALSVNLMYRLAEHFEVVIFRSLRDAPSCEALLDDCLQVLSPQSLGQAQEDGASPPLRQDTLEQRISLLLEHLRKTHALVVLDNLESLLQEGDVRGHLHPDFEGYGQLLHQVAETAHQSCLLLTSREKPAKLRPLEGKQSPVHSLRLTGLDTAACQQIFVEKELVGTEEDAEQLIETYGGNPLALKIVAETILDLFGGEISPFLTGNSEVFGGITDLLEEQFARLSALEQTVLRWLAIAREPMTLNELQALLVFPLPHVQVLEAVDSGYRRSLIERGKRPGSFTLQSVVLEYVTAVLIAEASNEIQQHRLDRLIHHGLEQAHAKEYVRQTQERLLLSPLLTSLQRAYGRRSALEEHLLGLLDQLREEDDSAQGYGPANLIALLRLQRGHLNALDLSQLCIRGAYLQGIEMQDASLAGSLIRDTVFTEAFSATWTVAISLDGRLWAAGSMQGTVRIWEAGGQTLRFVWQAHCNIVQSLAFSPDGRTLVSGGLDGTVKLWDVENGVLLWTGWQNGPQSLVFSPDSSLLASGGLDATIRLWDPQSGTNLQTLTHPGQVTAVAFSPDGSLLASCCFNGEIHLWERQKTLPSTCCEILRLSTSWVTSRARSLTFAPDGRTLASANWDRTITLWEVSGGHLLHRLPGQTNQLNHVVWSPDGRTLACSSYDKAIWLWDVEQGRYRAALHGHSADINGMAFTPDSSHLLSSSADSTLRIWEVTSGQCERVIVGYAVSLYSLGWSPDGTHVVSGGTDGLVTIWDLSSGAQPRVLHGHNWVVWRVGWSPNGRWIASCGWDAVIRLWDPISGASFQMFEDPTTILLGMAWSPDGNLLACGTYMRGMQVWDVTTRCLRWVGQPYLIGFLHVAWSPDGTRLVGGGDDGNVYLWEGTHGTFLQQLPGHQGRVISVEWSPDGTQLASGSESTGGFLVWDMHNKECVQTFAGYTGVVNALAWSRSQTGSPYYPGGDQLISGGNDGKLRWWDVKTGECLYIRAAHEGPIRSLRVSPDGKFLSSCGDDGVIRIWDLCSGRQEPRTVPTAPPLWQTLRRDRPYERLNITGIKGLNEAQKSTLRALGAFEIEGPVS